MKLQERFLVGMVKEELNSKKIKKEIHLLGDWIAD